MFKKGLSEEFIDALKRLAKENSWWKDVLSDPALVIGIRNDKMDIYWRGQAIFMVQFSGGKVRADTHVKYLLDPSASDRVALYDDGSFASTHAALVKRYEGAATLEKLKKAAGLFAGGEKWGVHAILGSNDNVVDVEIALDAKEVDEFGSDAGTSDKGPDRPRIDIAALKRKANGIELLFWEAKLFANKDLRSVGATKPRVVKQIEDYKKVLEAHRSEVISSYQNVAKNLVSIAEMSAGARNVGHEILEVAGGVQPTMSFPPDVGLVIFGFDEDQKREGSNGEKHCKKLKEMIGVKLVRTRGNADGLKL